MYWFWQVVSLFGFGFFAGIAMTKCDKGDTMGTAFAIGISIIYLSLLILRMRERMRTNRIN